MLEKMSNTHNRFYCPKEKENHLTTAGNKSCYREAVIDWIQLLRS